MISLTSKEKTIIVCLASIPILFLVYMVYAYSVDIPKRDDWAVASLIDKYYQGVLTWYDLFVQHNEHRLFFPYLIMLPTAKISAWDVRYWIVFNIIFSLGTFIVLSLQAFSTAKMIRNYKILWLIPLFSVMVFTLRQHDNWLWGFQLIVFMSAFFAVACSVVLARPSLRPAGFVLAIFLGIVASFSFANGMLVWPIGFCILLVNRLEKDFKKQYLLVWVAVSALILVAYLYGYEKPSHHPSLSFALKNPLMFLSFVFSYLASPFIETKSILAPATGLSGFIVFVYAATRLWRTGTVGNTAMLPYLALGLYSFLNAIIIAVGRAGWGVQESLNSRYVTHAIFFWIALAAILFLYFSDILKNTAHAKRGIIASASLYVITGLTLWAACASFKSIPWFFENYIHSVGLRCEIQISTDDDFAPEKVNYTYHKAFTTIREHKLAVFRNQ